MSCSVIVTGIGVVSAFGATPNAFRTGLTTGAVALSRAGPELELAGIRMVGSVRDFSAALFLKNQRQARVLNRTFELLIAAGALAAADARLAETPCPPSRLAVVVGVGPIDHYTDDLVAAVAAASHAGAVDLARFADAAGTLHPLRRLRLLPNTAAALLSIEHRAMGPSLTLVGGDASGLEALSQARVLIEDDRADAVLCGGADSRLTAHELRAWWPAGGDCRDIAPGEGAGVLVIERADSAAARGVHSYGALDGSSLTAVAYASRHSAHLATPLVTAVGDTMTARGPIDVAAAFLARA